MHEDMIYDGKQLIWNGRNYKATSGFRDWDGPLGRNLQNASKQEHRDDKHDDSGPIREGVYSFLLVLAKDARIIKLDDLGNGQMAFELDHDEGIERVPPTLEYNHQQNDTTEWGWGPERVRLTHTKGWTAKEGLTKWRGPQEGFYLHDSTKGFTHGCIEVEQKFFEDLRAFATLNAHRRGGLMYLRVKYPSPNASTYGDTRGLKGANRVRR